jgi:hypothetical protein
VLLRFGGTSGCPKPSGALLAHRLHRSVDTVDTVDSVDRASREPASAGLITVKRHPQRRQFLYNGYFVWRRRSRPFNGPSLTHRSPPPGGSPAPAHYAPTSAVEAAEKDLLRARRIPASTISPAAAWQERSALAAAAG